MVWRSLLHADVERAHLPVRLHMPMLCFFAEKPACRRTRSIGRPFIESLRL